jgi:hypothetical protein
MVSPGESLCIVHDALPTHRDLGEVVTESEVETSLQELKVLQTWFTDEVLRADEETGSSAILILLVGPR